MWTRLVGSLGALLRIADDDRVPALSARLAAIVGPALAEVGTRPVPGEADRDRERRGLLLAAAALLGNDPDAIAEARRLFAAERATPGTVDASLAAAAIRVVAATASEADLDEVFAGYRAASTPQEEQRYLNALPEVRDPVQFSRALELAAGGEVRTQNAPFVLGAAVANRDNGLAAWDLIERQWNEMNDRFPANSIAWLVNGVRAVFDAELAERICVFLASHPIPQATLAVTQHLERMAITIALHEREHDRL